MVAAASISITLDGQTHAGPSLEAVRPVLLSLARDLRNSRIARDESAEQQRLIKARLRLGAALLQLEPQVPRGQWGRLIEEVAQSCGVSKHTVKRAVRLAATLATKEGEPDAMKVLEARRALQKLRPNTKLSGARAHQFGVFSKDRNGARAHQSDRGLDGCADFAGDFQSDADFGDDAGLIVSLREAEELARAATGDVVDLPAIEVDSDLRIGAQLTFASLVEDVERRLEGVVAAVASHHAEEATARALAAKLREAAESIEREFVSKSPARVTEDHTRAG